MKTRFISLIGLLLIPSASLAYVTTDRLAETYCKVKTEDHRIVKHGTNHFIGITGPITELDKSYMSPKELARKNQQYQRAQNAADFSQSRFCEDHVDWHWQLGYFQGIK